MKTEQILISEMQDTDRAAWDAFVRNTTGGLPQHLSGWRDVMSKTYGYTTRYLMATKGKQVVGVLPLFIVRSLLVGNSAITMPGGLCANDAEIATALIAKGKEIAGQAGVKRLMLHDTRQAWPSGLQTTSQHVSWAVDARAGSEAMWKRLHRNIRRQVRIARKNGLTVEIDRSGKPLGDFYNVLSRFTHAAGTPLYGRNFLEHIVEIFPDEFSIAVVYEDKKPVGAYFQLIMGNTVYGTWGATLHEYLKKRVVYLAYWEMLHDTAENGYDCLDMGRSPADSNASKFKGQWGGVATPVHQQVASIGSRQPSESIVGQVNSDAKFQRLMQLWPKLPLPVAQFLGPKLRRHVPFA